MNWFSQWPALFKGAEDQAKQAEDVAIRSIAMLCGTIEVVGMNVNQLGRHTYNENDAITAARRAEQYIRGTLK